MTRRTLDPEKLVKIHIYNNLLAYYSETCLSIFVPKRQRIFVPLSHFDVRVIHSRSDGTHKIANIYGSRDALPIPLYIISAVMDTHKDAIRIVADVKSHQLESYSGFHHWQWQ